MPAKKVLVPVPVWASENDLPLGQPVLVVFRGGEGLLHSLLFAHGGRDSLVVRQKYTWTAGQLGSGQADGISAYAGSLVYDYLLVTDGIAQVFHEFTDPEQ
jgi:hypothetical protein